MNRIKDILKAKSITQKEIALKLGVSEPVISYAINGNPTLKTLEDIAKALDVRVSDLIDESDIDLVNCPYCGGKIKVSKE